MVKAEAAGGGGRKIGKYEIELMKTTWMDPTTTESEDWNNAAANLRGLASRIRTSDDLGEYWDSDAGKEARKTLEILYKRIDRHAEKLEKVKKSLDDVEKARSAAKTAYDELPPVAPTDCQVNAEVSQMHPPLVYKNPSEHELPEDEKRAKAWETVYEQNKEYREQQAKKHLQTFNTSMTEASQGVPLPEGAEPPPTTGNGSDTGGGGGYPGSTGTPSGSGNHPTNRPTGDPTQPPYNAHPGPDDDPIDPVNTHPTDPSDPDIYPTDLTDTETTDTETYPTDTNPYPTDDGSDGSNAGDGTWQTGPGGSYLPGGDTSADGVVSGVIPGASGGPGGLNGLTGTYAAGAAGTDGGLSTPAALGGGLVTGGASGLAAKAFGGNSGAVPATGPGGMATSARGGAGASGSTRSAAASGSTRSAAARSGSTSRAPGRSTGMSEAASGGRGSRGMSGMAMGGRGAGGGAAGSGGRASARTGGSRYGAPKLAEKAAAGKGGQGTGRGAAGAMAGSRGGSGSKEREQHDRDFLTHEDEENWYDEESETGPSVFE